MARKAGIALDEIVDAAAEIADRDGLEAATLSVVAAAVGIRTPSLHYRVGGTAGLRRLLAMRAAEQIASAFSACRSDPEPIRAMCHAYRRFANAHPGQYDALLPAPSAEDDEELSSAFARVVWVAADALTNLGVPELDLVHTVRAIRAALHGFVDNERRGGFGLPVDIDRSFEVMLDLLLPD